MNPEPPMLQLGQIYPPYGKLEGIMWLGERYYFFVDGNSVAMMPAGLFHPTPAPRPAPETPRTGV